MAGGHEGVFEDGVLATCGICGVETHMLDPEEMDWICDPCSTEGWAGVKQARKIRRGHRVSIRGRQGLVISADNVGRFVEIETIDPDGNTSLRFMRHEKLVYVHEQGDPERADAIVRERASLRESG
jgi:hypothetical protein